MTMEVSAEVHFAQTLASNDKKFRDRALKRLQKYISVRSSSGDGLSHDDFIKLWKGLHYCMWMQDKPLIQEELSQKMVSLLHAFPKLEDALSFVNVFFITEAREWTCIDRLRLDKFMLLIREMLHETFELLSRDSWPQSECQIFSQKLTAAVMNEDTVKIPYGIKMHLADIYMTELRKVSFSGMTAKKLSTLMFPFIYFLLKTKRRELARVVYDRTLRTALLEYGLWSWKEAKRKESGGGSGRNSKKEGRVEMDEGDDDIGAEMESEDEEEEEASEEEEEDEEEGEDDDVEMEVDDDEEEEEEDETEKKKRYNLSILLRLMHRLAQDPKVEIRNRKLVYGIVNGFTSKDSSILQSSQNGSGDHPDVGDFDITSVIQLTGETEKEDRDSKKRRRRNKKRSREQEGDEEEMVLEHGAFNHQAAKIGRQPAGGSEPASNSGVEADQDSEKNEQSKKRKKKKSALVEGGVEETQLITAAPVGKAVSEKMDKKNESRQGLLINGEAEHPESVTSQKREAKNKKRKRMSGGEDSESSPSSSHTAGVKRRKMDVNDNNDDDDRSEKILNDKSRNKSPSLGKGCNDLDKKRNENDKKSPVKESSNIGSANSPVLQKAQKSNKKVALKESNINNNNDNKSNNSNVNSNSRSIVAEKVRTKKPISLSSPVECVIYKQKSPTAKPASINKLTHSIASPGTASTTKFILSDSPTRSAPRVGDQKIDGAALSLYVDAPEVAGFTAENGSVSIGEPSGRAKKGERKSGSPRVALSSPPPSKRSTKSSTKSATPERAKDTVDNSKMMDSLYNVMSTPCNMIKKAVGLVAPATDPGVSREKTVVIPEQWTPGGQKKVVFDLRRNKANKFKDYLKTLANDPSPAFEPAKSPGQGILKSPSVDSVLSSLDSSLSSSSFHTPNTKNKNKKGKGLATKRKCKSPVLRGIR